MAALLQERIKEEMKRMLKKRRGKISDIIYDNTAYYNGKYLHFPTITGLNGILEEIISSNLTTDYIRITPFYVNEQLGRHIEFEEYMFYIECREGIDKGILEQHIKECLNPIDTPRALNDLKLGAILYPLCKHNDVVSFQKALQAYKKSLMEILPKLMEIATSEMELKAKDLPFGYFCFEIQSS